MKPDLETIDPLLLKQWRIVPIAPLETRLNAQWIVQAGGTTAILRRWSPRYTDLDFEIRVLEHLSANGWPVPRVLEPPTSFAGSSWGLFSYLPGRALQQRDTTEQRQRGRLLAELHQATADLGPITQRQGYTSTDHLVADPALLDAVRRYEVMRPDVGHVLRWHIERARSALDDSVTPVPQSDARATHSAMDRKSSNSALSNHAPEAPEAYVQGVVHSDFATWNLLFDDGRLSGVLDFEATHVDWRIADFANAWRGAYDDVIHGYEQVERLTDVERHLLAPIFWGWLMLGVAQEISEIESGAQDHGFSWQIKQLQRRSPMFGAFRESYRAP